MGISFPALIQPEQWNTLVMHIDVTEDFMKSYFDPTLVNVHTDKSANLMTFNFAVEIEKIRGSLLLHLTKIC